MTHTLIKISAISCLLLLAGCANLSSPAGTPVGHAMSWPARSSELARIQSWAVNGSVSIQHADKTDLASLQWQQQNQRYQFALFGPLGFGRVAISGAPGSITLSQSNKPPLSAATPELLLQNQLGWHIPVSNLYYWARGLPAPGTPAKTTFDAYHHLVKLEQDHWRVDYLQYQTVAGVDLPKRILLATPNLTIKLALREWVIAK